MKHYKIYITKSAEETQKLGKKIAKEILGRKPEKTAVVLGLWGDLGAGKTTFLQGFAEGLGIEEKITSPTFVIMKKFQIPKPKPYKYFYHFDLYRLESKKDLEFLDFKEIISNLENIVAIEKPEKIYPVKYRKAVISPKAKLFNRGEKIIPKKIISIKFDHN